MFEILRLQGSKEKGIALETRHGRAIKNAQAVPSSSQNLSQFELLCAKHPNWECRRKAYGLYNCFGLVWAARRTAIYDQSEVEAILEDDGYRLLSSSELPMIGDIVLYYDNTQQHLLHGGLVCDFRGLQSPTGEAVGRPAAWVLSKLNDALGEVLHHVEDPPYEAGHFVRQFWTDRLNGEVL